MLRTHLFYFTFILKNLYFENNNWICCLRKEWAIKLCFHWNSVFISFQIFILELKVFKFNSFELKYTFRCLTSKSSWSSPPLGSPLSRGFSHTRTQLLSSLRAPPLPETRRCHLVWQTVPNPPTPPLSPTPVTPARVSSHSGHQRHRGGASSMTWGLHRGW